MAPSEASLPYRFPLQFAFSFVAENCWVGVGWRNKGGWVGVSVGLEETLVAVSPVEGVWVGGGGEGRPSVIHGPLIAARQ